MKKFIFFLLLGPLLVACQEERPDMIFNKTVLNTNLITEFGSEIFEKRLEKGGEAQKSIAITIQHIEGVIDDIKKINPSDAESKALKKHSIKLFETVLPIYKNEYSLYAKLCDTNGSPKDKQVLLNRIKQNYLPEVDGQLNELYTMGQKYAEQHQINVKWGR